MLPKKEKFYTEPPYSYRPSIAQYLTTMDVNRDGFIADILHLDRKKNINIERYEKGRLRMRLLTDRDLNDNEVFLWNFLKERESQGVVEGGSDWDAGTPGGLYLQSLRLGDALV